MKHAITTFDLDNKLAHLESSNPKNIPHGFQTFFFYNTTESNMAISKTSDFLRGYLNY
jgi:hypothetical protein